MSSNYQLAMKLNSIFRFPVLPEEIESNDKCERKPGHIEREKGRFEISRKGI